MMLSIFLSKRKIQGMLLGVILLATLMTGSVPMAQAQAAVPALFSDAGDAAADLAWSAPNYVVQSRYVSVNTALLQASYGSKEAVQANPKVSLNLFDDVQYVGVITSVQKTANGYTWRGRLEGKARSYFTMLTYEDAFIAHVGSTDGIYEVSYAGQGGLYRVIKIDQSKFVDHDPAAVFAPPGEVIAEGDLGPEADSGSQIDIMVVYTDDARAAEGSTPAMKARIALAVTETNASYANAGITTRLRLVHVQEYSYVETGNLSTDLSRLANTTDTYFTSVHSLRNTYAADMVGLIVENGGSYCGLANAIMATASNAFQVTDRGCATGYYSFGHEFGHLQGARHDVYVDPSTTPYSYGHGYVHTGSTAATRWRTVMAYDTKCNDLGYLCTRLKYWSNPAKTYSGAAMGNTTAKNYLVLNNTDYTVANFRLSKIAQDFNSSFNGSSTGWTPVYGTWYIYGSAYYTTAGVANYWSSSKQGLYGDVTFEARMRRYGCMSCSNKLIVRGNPLSLDASKNWKSSYAFQYAADGKYSIYRYSSTGTPTIMKTWTTHAAIVAGSGQLNTLKVVAVGSSLKFYINGTLVWSGTDSSFATGNVGIAMFRDSSTGNYLDVDWAKATTTATSDLDPNEQVVPGVEVGGGTPDQAP